jgi:pimeloyl-ACP methyl ester carboxylesterase
MVVDLQKVIAEADLRAEAQALNVPLTIIHGDVDKSCPIDLTGRRYAALVPGAEFITYQGAAHGLVITHAARLVEDIATRLA